MKYRHRVKPLVLCLIAVVAGSTCQVALASSVSTGVMATGRYFHTATLLPDGTVFIAGGNDDHLGLDTFEIFDPLTNMSTLAGERLISRRSYHTATLLPDGRVLLVGGTSNAGTSELFDYVTGTSAPSPATLNNPRYDHTTTLLTDGRVLVAGGWGTGVGSTLDTFEILDPASGPGARWVQPAGTMTAATVAAPRRYHTATLLDDGRVLIVGGTPNTFDVTASCGILDPATGAWTEVADLNTARRNHVAVKLQNGTVMVVGGSGPSSSILSSFEIFDPASPGAWSTPTTPGPGEELEYPRSFFGAALLPDGRVLVAGDNEMIEVYDPTVGAWGQWTTLSETLNTARISPTVTLLADGRVLTTGGRMGGAISWFELIHVDDISVEMPTQALVDPRSRHTATVLPDGRVLAIGGVDDTDPISPLSSCEVFDPGSDSWASDENLATARYSHTATLLADGRILVVGGTVDGASALASVELYNPGPTPSFGAAASLADARFNHTATLLADGRVMVTGGYNGSTYLDSVEIYDPGDDSWTTITVDPLNVARELHTATLLNDGKVLVVGGRYGTGWWALHNTFEVFDPEAGAWSMSSEVLHRARVRHTAIPFTDGRVAAIGGRLIASQHHMTLDSFETFDPSTGVWSMTAEALSEGRYRHSTSLLADGQVLVVGGWGGYSPLDSVELLNPEIGSWTVLADPLNEARCLHTATVLVDGRILITGGENCADLHMSSPAESLVSSTSEIINPVEGTYSAQPEIQSVLSNADVQAVRDSQFTAPWCDRVGPACDSGVLLWSRGTISSADNLDEPNQPNTLDACSDGSNGVYHADESIDRLRVVSANGSRLTASALASIEVDLWAFDSTDWLDLYHTDDAYNPAWETHIATINLTSPGAHHISQSFTLGSGKYQAIRAHLRYGGSPAPCNNSPTFDDHDDLVFKVYPSSTPLVDSLNYGDSLTITGTAFGGTNEASSGITQNSAVNYPVASLRSIENDRFFRLFPDLTVSFADDPSNLSFSALPEGLDVGRYYLTVTRAGTPSEAQIVEMGCDVSIGTLGHPSDQMNKELGDTADFRVIATGVRSYQWQRCTTGACGPPGGDWVDIPGARGSSYTTEEITTAHSGWQYRVEVRSSCGLTEGGCDSPPDSACQVSNPAVLTVRDTVSPAADVISPNGGEYWLLSEPGYPANEELVTWSMSDDIRVCQAIVALQYCDPSVGSCDMATGGWSGVTADCGIGTNCEMTYGSSGACVHPGISTTSALFTVPTDPPSGTPGSLYRIHLTVSDHASNTVETYSEHPFYIVQSNPEAVKTLILWHSGRISDPTGELALKLGELAGHPRVQGLVIDLAGVGGLSAAYASWDADWENATLANNLVVDVHDYLLDELLPIYTGVEFLVFVGDDGDIPFARLPDGAALHLEHTYSDGPDITADTTVGAALDDDFYLSDDPMTVLDGFTAGDLATSLFIPDLKAGRLVETADEIITTIATFISTDGVLDLTAMDPTTGHKALVTGYDFLIDAATVIRERWKTALGAATPDASTEPVDGVLISSDWGESTPGDRATALRTHLSGNGGDAYGVASLSGHATHYEEGVPGTDPFDIEGLDTADIYGPDGCGSPTLGAVDLTGTVIYGIGCHGGLSVPGSCAEDSDHSLDLPQTFLSRGALAYLANTGYGWGLKHGIGYSERLVEIFTEELTGGGTVEVGEAAKQSKLRYALESPRFDAYDEKTSMQWTLYGLPMAGIRTGVSLSASESSRSDGDVDLGPVKVSQTVSTTALPSYLTRLEMHFDLTAPGVYTKRGASGEVLPTTPGCPDTDGCYYTLNGLVERGSASADLPIQPYLIFDSRLSGTSQHGVLWMGGTYDEETGWIPVIAELSSNGGDGSDHGDLPRTARARPGGTRVVGGEDPADCRPSDLELNGLVLTTGEAVREEAEYPMFSTERIYRGIDVEILYYNNTYDQSGNCDREGPLLGTGPYGGEYHQLSGNTLTWNVPTSDAFGTVWRVVVVINDGTVDGLGQGQWTPIELTDSGGGTFIGSFDATGVARLTYYVQAVDNRGNVSTLDWVTTHPAASGIEHDIPDAVDVEVGLIFSDALETGDLSRWSGGS